MRIRLGLLWLLLTATGASAQSLEQQAMCAKQAKVALQEYEDNNKMFASVLQQHNEYQSHYSTKLNKCFIDIQTMAVSLQANPQSITTGDLLMDAFEQRVYAQYISTFPNEPTCDLIPALQSQTHCSSKDEYDAFVAKYMEE